MLVPGRRGDREGEEGGSTSRHEASCRRSGGECDRAAQGGRDRGRACGVALRTGRNVSANAARPALKVVDAALVLATGAAALEPPASIAKLANEQLLHDHSTPSQVEGQTLLTGSAGCQPRGCGLPVAFPIAEAGDDGPRWTAIWFGVLLMALGLVSVLSASRTIGGPCCWAMDATELVGMADDEFRNCLSTSVEYVQTGGDEAGAIESRSFVTQHCGRPGRPGGDGVQNQKTAHSELEKVRGNRDDRPHRPRGAPVTHPTLQRA